MLITDYIKIEEIKSLVVSQLIAMNLIEQTMTLNDHDLNLIITMMARLSSVLNKKETDDEKINLLIGYVIGLWAKLIIDYGATKEDL